VVPKAATIIQCDEISDSDKAVTAIWSTAKNISNNELLAMATATAISSGGDIHVGLQKTIRGRNEMATDQPVAIATASPSDSGDGITWVRDPGDTDSDSRIGNSVR